MVLDMHSFDFVERAQKLATQLLWRYDNDRPYMAIGGVPQRYLTSHWVAHADYYCVMQLTHPKVLRVTSNSVS